ncbi:MAG: hypothetical protein E6Z78_04370 [Veillonella sp.]|nr:hypothetical protein [Veillonella sp.]
MNLQDYIERMKMWIDKQHFIMRHYKFALGIFNEAQKNYQKKQHMIIEMGKERTILKMKVI